MSAHRSSLARARERVEMLAAAEREYLASSPYRLAHEHDMRGGRYVVHVHVTRPFPDEIVRLAGDVARGLRTALDELATSLAGAPVTFPIFESLALFAQRARKPIARMSDQAQATLEALQPYHAIGGFRSGTLWTLERLTAVDPPRLAAGSIRHGATMGVNTERKVSLQGEPAIVTGAFDDGDVIASVPTKVVGPDPKLDMFMRAEYAIAYAKDGPARGREVVTLLGQLCDHVEHAVFGALEPSAT
jgi:hypothetical protein